MKKTYTLIIISIFVLSLPNAQAQKYKDYHYASIGCSIPSVIDFTKKVDKRTGEDTEHNNPAKEGYVGISMHTDNMQVNGNYISGIQTQTGGVADIVTTFFGKISDDEKSLEYFDITYTKTGYSIPNREKAYIQEETKTKIHFENLQASYNGYNYRNGISTVDVMEHEKKYVRAYRYGTETTIESFVKPLDGRNPSITLSLKQGNTNMQKKPSKKITVNYETKNKNDEALNTLISGFAAPAITALSKVKDAQVLEGMKMKYFEEEIKLSQSGLVSEETKIDGSKLQNPDIALIFYSAFREPEFSEQNKDVKNAIISCYVLVLSTGQKIQFPEEYFYVKGKSKISDSIKYAQRVSHFASGFIY